MMKPKTKPKQTEEKPEEVINPLLQRLATGDRVPVAKKEMLALTNKNYNNLPEVQKRKVEEQKKSDFKERMRQVKELESKRRQLVKAAHI